MLSALVLFSHTYLLVPGVGAKLNWTSEAIRNTDNITDIFSGEKVRELVDKGWFQEGSQDIGLVMSTDGGVLFKRTSINVWPIWAVIANLPPKLR